MHLDQESTRTLPIEDSLDHRAQIDVGSRRTTERLGAIGDMPRALSGYTTERAVAAWDVDGRRV